MTNLTSLSLHSLPTHTGSFGRVRFAFRLFDLNNDGRFSKFELLNAIKASEARHEKSSESTKKMQMTYWGDRAATDPFTRYKDIIDDMNARSPESMGYEEFTRVVTRYPRIFAPVNQVWHALREFADPAVKVVRQIRESGNQGFFKGTLLEPGRGELIFAPTTRGTGDARAQSADAKAYCHAEKQTATRRGDQNQLTRWLDDAAASVKRVSSFGLQENSHQRDQYKWDDGSRSATPAEQLAETQLKEDQRVLRLQNKARAGYREVDDLDDDVASDVTMNEIWDALRGAPNPAIHAPVNMLDRSKSDRLQIADAAAATVPPFDYANRLDAAANAQALIATERSRRNALRFQSKADQQLAEETKAPEWIRQDAAGVDQVDRLDDTRNGARRSVENDARQEKTTDESSARRRRRRSTNDEDMAGDLPISRAISSRPRRRSVGEDEMRSARHPRRIAAEGDGMRLRRGVEPSNNEGKNEGNRNISAIIAAHKTAARLRRHGNPAGSVVSDESSAFRKRVAKYVAMGPASAVEDRGLR